MYVYIGYTFQFSFVPYVLMPNLKRLPFKLTATFFFSFPFEIFHSIPCIFFSCVLRILWLIAYALKFHEMHYIKPCRTQFHLFLVFLQKEIIHKYFENEWQNGQRSFFFLSNNCYHVGDKVFHSIQKLHHHSLPFVVKIFCNIWWTFCHHHSICSNQ